MDNNFDQFDIDFQEKPIDWREIYERLLSKWKWFVFSGITALILGAVYARMQPDVYELKSSILIIDQSRSGQMNEMSVLRQLDAAGMGSRSSSMVNNEEQVLKSGILMRRVVNMLELHTSYTGTSLLKREDLYSSSPYYLHLDSASLAALQAPLQITLIPEGDKLTVNGQYKKAEFSTTVRELPALLRTPAGLVYLKLRKKEASTDSTAQLVRHYSVATELKQGFLPDSKIEITVNNPLKVAKSIIQSALTTEVGKMIDVIDLSYRTGNVQQGKDLLNTLAAVYNQDASEQNNLSANNTARFIETRLRLLAEELTSVEKDVENYKQSNNLTDIDEDAKLFLDRTKSFEQQQIEVEMQQNLVKFVEDFIKSPANRYNVVPNMGLTDASLAAMILKYNELLLARVRVADGSSDTNPALKAMNMQVDAARKAVETGIVNSRKGLQLTKKELANKNTGIQTKIREIPRQEREMMEIKRQQQVKAQLYLFLLQKREEASLNMAVNVPKGRVLNTPDDASVVGPHRNIIMVVFLFIGLLIPAVIIYMLDLMNTTIRNRQDVEKRTSVPVITELAHHTGDSEIIDNRPNASSNAELFRLLRTKLQFTLDGPDKKVIMVSSTVAGEGKTFVSINLAMMLALADKKVLLMGMDLRKPQLANHFNIKNKDGVSAWLAGQTDNYRSLIVVPEEYPYLDILHGGIIPPNPTELLAKKRLDELIADAKKDYDYIVIDSAPVGAVSDSFLIDRVSDMTLYVCRAGYSDVRSLEYVNRIDKEKNLKHLYLVVNDVDMAANSYSYHRKYGYGYGYGYEKGKRKE